MFFKFIFYLFALLIWARPQRATEMWPN